MAENRWLKAVSEADWAARFTGAGRFISDFGREFFYGIRHRRLPVVVCNLIGAGLNIAVVTRLDRLLLERIGLAAIYPTSVGWFAAYVAMLSASGYLGWGLWQLALKRRLIGHLTEVFQSIGLRNQRGKLPGFIFDRPLDAVTRKLRLSRAHLAIERFVAVKSDLEAALQIYIDTIRENRDTGSVDIIYSHHDIPNLVPHPGIKAMAAATAMIGKTRSQDLLVNLSDVPHLLVAGETASGKSTFLRQLITSLYVNNPGYRFSLVDLKGGLEFQLFDGLPRVTVLPDAKLATKRLAELDHELDDRMRLLAANRCKDIAAYSKIPPEKRKPPAGGAVATDLARHILVIDEATELFLAGGRTAAKETQRAREIASRLSRLGRAVGLHVIVGTQRPDARALDPQIKANLAGKVCFQVANLTSSMVILDNGRAKDLPPVPGRAIWQHGLVMCEVQTPYLDPVEVEALLGHLRTKDEREKTNASGQPLAVSADNPATTMVSREVVRD